jgi:hypothetical protein
MHAALWTLYEEAGRLGYRRALRTELIFDPSPEVGRAARGADGALRDLVRGGILTEEGDGLSARLEVGPAALVAARRDLLSCEPALVELLQRAGSRWAALASTVAKNADGPTESVGTSVASGTA